MTRRSQFKIPKIPEMTVRRLSVYTRCLLQLEEDGVKTISSQELAERFSLNSAQVRKDLAYFGEFGVRGIGVVDRKGNSARALTTPPEDKEAICDGVAALSVERILNIRRRLDFIALADLLPRRVKEVEHLGHG